MFDSLRLELAPFGVTTTSVIVGPVRSLLHSDKELWKLPEDSLYAGLGQKVVEFSKGNDGAPRQDTFTFAEGVVDKILRGNNSKFWAGAYTAIFKFAALWLPQSWLVCIDCKRGQGGC
jgi:1-acylglycerone phosphate reductase